MAKEKGLTKYAWLIIMILSLILIGVSLWFEFSLKFVLKTALEMPGSSFTLDKLDEAAVDCFNGLLYSVAAYGICFGIFGLFLAWWLKKKEKFAWKFGILWSVILVAYGIISAVLEILFWWIHKPIICPLLFLSIMVGVITLWCLIVIRKEFL